MIRTTNTVVGGHFWMPNTAKEFRVQAINFVLLYNLVVSVCLEVFLSYSPGIDMTSTGFRFKLQSKSGTGKLMITRILA